MATLKEIIKVTSDQYAILEGGGTISGHTGLDENAIYLIPGSGGGGGSADVTFVDWTASLITFTYNTNTSLQAEQGMTWEEWVNSEYNTINASVSGSYIWLTGVYQLYSVSPNIPVVKTDIITANAAYYGHQGSGGSMN